VPRATNAIALTPSLRWMKQPRWPATSPMTAVKRPMEIIEVTKVGYPLRKAGRQEHALEEGGVTSTSVMRLLVEEVKRKNRTHKHFTR